ncbi:clathrin heavy chain [Nilaparvata lugens]|uniref:clathrin heavy chain n=1 Tax=Nilaparvata lugens TaxID=108931 RepID=UPI00193E664D|nr:clathrin heavy chain [Nilaparvata lugens]
MSSTLATSMLPITLEEHLDFDKIGIKTNSINFSSISMEDERYICVQEKNGEKRQLAIVDVQNRSEIMRQMINAEAMSLNAGCSIIILKLTIEGDLVHKKLQIIDFKTKILIKQFIMDTDIVFWKWISESVIALVTGSSVYHWSIDGDSDPVKIFDRHQIMKGDQIISYKADNILNWVLLIGLSCQNNRVVGTMQLYCVQVARSQIIEAHSACFTTFKMEGNQTPSNLICLASRQEQSGKLYIIETGQTPTGNAPFSKKTVDMTFISEHYDFPVAIQPSSKYDFIFVITKYGYLHLFEVETAICIFVLNIPSDGTVFLTVPQNETGGILAINSKGKLLSAAINETNMIDYLRHTLANPVLACRLALKHNISGADDLFLENFNQSVANRNFVEAVKIAANAPNGILRTPQTMQVFQSVSCQPGEKAPIRLYFEALLENGRLNAFESIALCKPVIAQNRINILHQWLQDDKFEYSEQLGDLIKPANTLLALSVYLRANIPHKVIQCFLETHEYQKIILYSQKVGYNPDYLTLLRSIIWSDAKQAVSFAKSLVADSNISVDVNNIVDLFIENNSIQECTDFLLDFLSRNSPEDCSLQTRLLEMTITSAPAVADDILQRKLLSHYDQNRIAQLCEKFGLFERALDHYTELNDIKRILVNSQLLNPVWLVNFFSKLSIEDTLTCLDTMLLANMRHNTQACVQIAVRYYEQLTIKVIIDIFERYKCYEGIFHFLASVIAFNNEEQVHFKYIEAACKTNQFKELERMCRESNFYNGRNVFNYLKSAKLQDQISIIIVCDRFNFVDELVIYLYQNNLHKYIEVYVQKVNASRLPAVVGSLLDAGCHEEIVKNLISTVPNLYSTVELIDQVERRNRLKLLLPWLEQQVEKGNGNSYISNSLAKIHIDTNNNPERFLKENRFYDSLTIGKYCEKRNPHLSFIAYKRGQCDQEVIKLCQDASLFKLEAGYLIERGELHLWAQVLNEEQNTNRSRKALVDHVVKYLLETKNPQEITTTIKAFVAANVTHELLELLERLLFDNSTFSEFSTNSTLQNLLLLTAMKSDKSRVLEYIDRLNAYDPTMISNVAINNGLFEEVIAIHTKFNDNANAILTIINYLDDMERAYNFAERCNETIVWSHLAEAQLEKGFIKEAIQSFIKAEDPTKSMDVIGKAGDNLKELKDFLIMARKKMSNSYVDDELLYIYAISKKHTEIEEFLSQSNHADLLKLGERCFNSSLFEAAKIFFSKIANFAALASTCVRLNELEEAVSNARKANILKTWKEVCFACIENGHFALAQVCGLNVVTCVDELVDVIDFYNHRGYFNELMSLLESALSLENVNMGIFTELAILYSQFATNKLREHLELFWSRMNIPKVLKAAMKAHLWSDLVFLYDKCEDYDNAISVMIDHPTEAWKGCYFKDMIPKVTNIELYYSAVSFYLEYKPLLLNEILLILAPRIDHSRCINFFSRAGHLKFIQKYLMSVQSLNNKAINEALNSLYIEEYNYDKLITSINNYDNFDIIVLAQKLEDHQLIEFRRIAAYLYKKNNRWNRSMQLCRDNGLYKDAIEYAADSHKHELIEDLLIYFLEGGKFDFFVAALFQCYNQLRPDVIMELSWKYDALNYAMPYFVQVIHDYMNKINSLLELTNQQ